MPLELDWQASVDECPTQVELVRQVAALVERHPSFAYPVRATARVERLGSQRYQGLLETESQGARGTRLIEGRSCRALGDIVVLILAWMIQPELSSDSTPTPVAQPDREAAKPRPARVVTAPTTSAWVLSLRGSGDLGSLPKPALGGLLAVGYRSGHFQLSLQSSYFPHSRGEIPSVAGYRVTGGDFSLLAFSLLSCLEPTWVRVALCAGPELNREQASGFGVSSPKTGVKSWFSLTGGLRSALRLSEKLWLEASAELVVPTLREEFVLESVGVVHRPAAVSARTSLGLGLTL